MCHLIYPASTPWHATSTTKLALVNAEGVETASQSIAIPCGGSHLLRVSETFDAGEIESTGPGAYVLIRDLTCRLFGYHGLVHGADSFRSEEHTSELQSLMRISYAVFCLKKKNKKQNT